MLVQFALPQPEIARLGHISQFQPGQPVLAEAYSQKNSIIVWVVNLDGEFRVFDTRPTHPGSRGMNCRVEWITESQPWSSWRYYFSDPCVGGAWSMDGTYLWGPAPRNLDFYPVEVRKGELWIDLMQLQKGEAPFR